MNDLNSLEKNTDDCFIAFHDIVCVPTIKKAVEEWNQDRFPIVHFEVGRGMGLFHMIKSSV